MYFDSHCHLNSKELLPNYDLYINNALDNEVEYMLVVGYDLESSKKAVEIAKLYDFIYAGVGIGPNDCLHTTEEDLKIIDEYLDNPKVVALGEIGLDYYWDEVPSDKQKDIFRKQIALAKKHDKPILIHCRDAYEDTYDILKETKHYGVMHCYSGSWEMAKRYIDLGYYISLAGPVTFKNAKVPKEVATNISLDNLLIETDSPYLSPMPYRGKQNEPANVIYIAHEVAKLKKVKVAEVEQATTNNAKKLFKV